MVVSGVTITIGNAGKCPPDLDQSAPGGSLLYGLLDALPGGQFTEYKALDLTILDHGDVRSETDHVSTWGCP